MSRNLKLLLRTCGYTWKNQSPFPDLAGIPFYRIFVRQLRHAVHAGQSCKSPRLDTTPFYTLSLANILKPWLRLFHQGKEHSWTPLLAGETYVSTCENYLGSLSQYSIPKLRLVCRTFHPNYHLMYANYHFMYAIHVCWCIEHFRSKFLLECSTNDQVHQLFSLPSFTILP